MFRLNSYPALSLALLSAAGMSFLACAFGAEKENGPKVNATGVPGDVDYQKGNDYTQIIIHKAAPSSDQLIARSTNPRLISSVLVALALKREVKAEYIDDSSKRLTSVSFSVVGRVEEGHIWKLSYDEKDGYCRATIIDNMRKEDVWTKSPQMQAILEAAAHKTLPILEFRYDRDTREIIRGKVNQ